MILHGIDLVIIAFFLLVFLGIGIWASRSAGKSSAEFFLSGRNMPWWLLGVSMVATTFSADTPNLVTDIVRQHGVAGNWKWWAFCLTGLLTVFVYARLWKRSGVFTDIEFYELRYSGWPAAFLRGFRAVYLGLFFNVMIMATVMLAGIKIASVLLGISPITAILLVSGITLIYATLGGLKGVILTDMLQFVIAMTGTIWAAIYIINMPEIGNLETLFTHSGVSGSLNFIPDPGKSDLFIELLIIPLAVQWWSVWYPGSEPGGGGYIAQRMLAAKSENHAMSATLLFNITHYALRPWPWILIALASLIFYPDLAALKGAFPSVSDEVMGHDLAYPAMLTHLPKGLLGLVVLSLLAAFMSTLSTHLNWGASYLVHDTYQRFYRPEAGEKELVLIGRICTVVLMILTAFVALYLESALDAFNILLQIGAGTGLIFILRWFWWRINAYSEITAMVVSFAVVLFFEQFYPGIWGVQAGETARLLWGVGITTVCWLLVTFLTRPTDRETLRKFLIKVRPHRLGWQNIIRQMPKEEIPSAAKPSLGREIANMFAGCFGIYGLLFCTGAILYGRYSIALVGGGIACLCTIFIIRNWKYFFAPANANE